MASYNVLAQDLLEEHHYLYRHCAPQHLDWSYRRQNVMKQLNKHNPDVCLRFLLCTGCGQKITHYEGCLLKILLMFFNEIGQSG